MNAVSGAAAPRIGFVGVLVSDRERSAAAVNRVLSDHAAIIRARLGVPWKDRDLAVVTLVVEATTDEVGALAGSLGRIPGVSVKTGLAPERRQEGSAV